MLTEDDLRALIATGERFDVEFRGEQGEALGDRELVEQVVCLANARGGTLLLGRGGRRPRHRRPAPARQLHGPPPPGGAHRRRHGAALPRPLLGGHARRRRGRRDRGARRPADHLHRPGGLQAPGDRRRRAATCVPFHFHEMQSREAGRGALDYSALVLPEARWEDLDPLEFERLRQTIARNPGRADATLLALSDQDIVKALGLVESSQQPERLRVAAVLLVGREEALRRLVPTHEVAFQVLSGTRVAVNDFFRGPLLRVADEIARRFEARNEEEEIAVGQVRGRRARLQPVWLPRGGPQRAHPPRLRPARRRARPVAR
jgi:ATP-dependent DNA helicase RecG